MKLKLLFLTLLISINLAYSQDTDGDGVPDSVDLDSDNDGILDADENNSQSLSYEFYNVAPSGSTVDNIPTTGALATGTVSDFDVDALWQSITPGDEETFSIRYTGLINISTPGDYTFFTTSDDGSKLFIDGTEVVDNDGNHGVRERSGVINLSSGEHTIRVLFFEDGGTESLAVSYSGPSIPKTALPFSILRANSLGGDTDGDGVPDYLDLDSDGDGCSDANEYYGLSNADGGDDGVFGSGIPTVDADGLVVGASYNGNYYSDVIDDSVNRSCIDFDSDSVPDFIDLDDDNDGILDNDESNLIVGELNYEYYDLVPSGNTVDNIPTSGALQSGTISDFDVSALSNAITGNTATYSVRYTGFIQIDTDDIYIFYTNSDDGSKLSIDGVEVVDNDGLHGQRERSGSISLTIGIYPIEILFFENNGNDILEVSYQSSSVSKTALPFSILASNFADIDTDNDGTPDYLDLDSDNDGCSDANEYYKDPTADGGDGGEFGNGTPSVDANGLVIGAGYDGTGLANVRDDTISSNCTTFIFETAGDWNTANNWNTNIVPSNIDFAIIRANATVSNNQNIGTLTIDPTYSVSINDGQNLTIEGDIINNGSFTGEGEVVLTGTSAQSISGGGSFENLRLDNPTSLDFTDPTDLFGVVYVDQGTLNTNGNLSLRCDFVSGKTAQVGPVGGTIVGDVTVEQCYPARRAFRFLSPSVTTATSIRENWQENPVGYLDNPRLGYGTHITGVSPGSANASVGQDGNNGFDYNPSGNASMFTFDNSTPSWDRVTNANGVLTAGEAYRLFLRGDRSIDITLNESPPTATRLSATGVLAIGAQTETNLSNTANAFNFIGNPYQAQVNVNSLVTGSTNISSAEYYVWDPTLGGSPTPGLSGGRGAYVTVNLPSGTNSFSPSGTNKGSNANQFLQPMQAAFVRTNTDAPASVTFQEAMKAVNEIQTDVKSNSVQEYINIQLFNANSFAEGATPSDGLRINFNKSFITTTEDDSPKLGNLDENLARVEGNAFSAIERRPLPEATEELPLFINQYRRESYVMKFDVTDNLNTQIFVKDNYLESLTEITSSDNTYSFAIESSIPESVASDRFSLVFEPVSLSIGEEGLANLSLYPNPTKGNFSISGIDSGQYTEVKIYNLIGQQVYTAKSSGQSTLEITDFNGTTGVYLVKLNTNQGGKTFKLIKD
jgi:hypothetical protein